MGFFSWCCKRCGVSIVAEPAACPVTAWQTEAVLVGKEGQAIVRGTYDGYGRIGDAEIEGICGGYDDVCLYHAACYDSAQRAGIVDSSPSVDARDQGYWIKEGSEHDAPPPSVDADWLARQSKLRRDSKPRDTQSPLGSKPWLAAAYLAQHHRVPREFMSPYVKAGFTLLEKRGLVENVKGTYRPVDGASFWDVVERERITSDGRVTDRAKSAINLHEKGESGRFCVSTAREDASANHGKGR